MAESTENLTLKMLREMREDMKDMRKDVGALREEMQEGFREVNTRIDGVTHVLMLLAGNAHDHETRIEKLEAKRP